MNILPTIVQEVVSQCKSRGFAVSANLAGFYIRCQLLTAKKDAANNVELSPEHIERLVSQAATALTQPDSVVVETFKLQASVTALQQDQANRFRTERVQHKAKSHRIVEDLWTKRDPNEVFGDIALFILHESRCLNPQAPPGSSGGDGGHHSSHHHHSPGQLEAAQRETLAALESVFPKVHMESFVAQREAEKQRQLEEMWRIVWGIRLFNRETGKSDPANGIPNLLAESLATLTTSAQASLKLLVDIDRAAKDYVAVLGSPSLQLSDAQRARLLDEYHNRLQVAVYLRSLLFTVNGLLRRLSDELEPAFRAIVDEARALVSAAAGAAQPIAKGAIYPRFISLTESWDLIVALHREARDAQALAALVAGYAGSFSVHLRERDVQSAVASAAEQRPVNRQLIAADIAGSAAGAAVTYVPQLSDEIKDTRLEFNGFCVVSFVDDGILRDGHKSDGDANDQSGGSGSGVAVAASPGFVQLHANSAYYAFQSERALKAFVKDPFRYLSTRLMECVQSAPVLVHLLGLHPYLPKELYLTGARAHDLGSRGGDSGGGVGRVVESSDGAAQTGQIDAYKDYRYQWNEWELRRLALKLAALRTKRTRATQTALSHFRRDNDCQVFQPKEQGAQTLVDAATQPPRVVRYVKGLRGSETSELETIEKVFMY